MADENVWRLAQIQKEQNENLCIKIIELHKELDAKQVLIKKMRGTIQVMKHVEEQNLEAKEKMSRSTKVMMNCRKLTRS